MTQHIFFVTGSSRSGTTMMSRILGNHSTIFSFNELHFFEQLCQGDNLDKSFNHFEALALADRLIGIQKDGFLHYGEVGKYTNEAKQIVQQTSELKPVNIYQSFIKNFALANGKLHGCDQTPRNALYIKEILKTIPDAKIICMVRDPRAVLLSQKGKWKRKFLGASKIPYKETIRSFFNYHPYTISKLWVAAAKQIVEWEKTKNVLVVKFEDLVQMPASNIERICNFLEIPFETSMMQIPHVGSSNKSDDGNKTTGISADTKELWKCGGLTKAELYICQKTSGAYMQLFDYKLESFKVLPYVTIAFQVVAFPFKAAMALLLNLNRVRNLRQAIIKRL